MAVSPPFPPVCKALDSKFSGQRGQILSDAFLRVEGPGFLNIADLGGGGAETVCFGRVRATLIYTPRGLKSRKA